MKRIIKEFDSLSDRHFLMIKHQYPKGFGDSDLITLKTSTGDYFDALEVKTNEALYLVKVTHDMLERIDQIEELTADQAGDNSIPESW
jgi:hypothetical protein